MYSVEVASYPQRHRRDQAQESTETNATTTIAPNANNSENSENPDGQQIIVIPGISELITKTDENARTQRLLFRAQYTEMHDIKNYMLANLTKTCDPELLRPLIFDEFTDTHNQLRNIAQFTKIVMQQYQQMRYTIEGIYSMIPPTPYYPLIPPYARSPFYSPFSANMANASFPEMQFFPNDNTTINAFV